PRGDVRRKRVQRGHVREDECREERERSDEGAGEVACCAPDLRQVASCRKLRLAEYERADISAEQYEQLRDRRSLFVLRLLVLYRRRRGLINRLGHDLPLAGRV